jgi:malonyl-CoA O-methyltransferase
MAFPDFRLDRRRVRLRAGRAAATYPQADFLAREVSRRMAERLDYIRLAPGRVVDLGCGPAVDLAMLKARYPAASCIGVDFALPMLRTGKAASGFIQRLLGRPAGEARICADSEALPLARGSISLVWSNLMLNWLHDPVPTLKEIHRALEVGGMVMFSTLGPDTLQELRRVMPNHAGERVHRFIDMHDLGVALVQVGFSDPVMDMEQITLTYPDFDRLLAELRATGSTNASLHRPRALSGRAGWNRARAAYAALAAEGRLPATFEVIQGHAWKAAPKLSEDGRAIIRFDTPPKRV